MKVKCVAAFSLASHLCWAQHSTQQINEAFADTHSTHPPACLQRVLEHHADQNSGSFWTWIVGMDDATKAKVCDAYVKQTAGNLDQILGFVDKAEGLQFSRASLTSGSFDCAPTPAKNYSVNDKRNAAFSYLFSMKRLEAYDRRVRDEWLALQRLQGPAKPPSMGNPAFEKNNMHQQAQLACPAQTELRSSLEQTISKALDLYGRLLNRRFELDRKIGPEGSSECPQILDRSDRIADGRDVVQHCRDILELDDGLAALQKTVPFFESGPVQKLFTQVRNRETASLHGYDTPMGVESRAEFNRRYLYDKGTLEATVSNAVAQSIRLEQSKLSAVISEIQEGTDCLQGVPSASAEGCVKNKVSPLMNSAPSLSLDEFIQPLSEANYSREARQQAQSARSDLESAKCRAEIESIRKTSKQIGFDLATTAASLGIGAAAKGAMMAGQFAARAVAAGNTLKNASFATRMATAVPRVMNARGLITTAALANLGVDASRAIDTCLHQQSLGLEELPEVQKDTCGTSNLLPMQLATQGYLQCTIDTAAAALSGTVASGTLREAFKPADAYAQVGGRMGSEAGRVRLANRRLGPPVAPEVMHAMNQSQRGGLARDLLGLDQDAARLSKIKGFDEAIERAHLVGKGELGRDAVNPAGWSIDASGGFKSNYTAAQIAQKRSILESLKTASGQRALRDDEIDLLLDRGVVGLFDQLLGRVPAVKVQPLPKILKDELTRWTDQFRGVGGQASHELRLSALAQMSSDLRAALFGSDVSAANFSAVLKAHGVSIADSVDLPFYELRTGPFVSVKKGELGPQLERELKAHNAGGPLASASLKQSELLALQSKASLKVKGNSDPLFTMRIDQVGAQKMLSVPTPEGFVSYPILSTQGEDLILEVPFGKINRTQFSVDPKLVEKHRGFVGPIDGDFVYGGRLRFTDKNHRFEALYGGNKDPNVMVTVKVKAPRGSHAQALNPFDLLDMAEKERILGLVATKANDLNRDEVLGRLLPRITSDFDAAATASMQPIQERPFFQFDRHIEDITPNR